MHSICLKPRRLHLPFAALEICLLILWLLSTHCKNFNYWDLISRFKKNWPNIPTKDDFDTFHEGNIAALHFPTKIVLIKTSWVKLRRDPISSLVCIGTSVRRSSRSAHYDLKWLKIVDKSLTTNERVVNNSLTTHEQGVNKLWISNEQIMNK